MKETKRHRKKLDRESISFEGLMAKYLTPAQLLSAKLERRQVVLDGYDYTVSEDGCVTMSLDNGFTFDIRDRVWGIVVISRMRQIDPWVEKVFAAVDKRRAEAGAHPQRELQQQPAKRHNKGHRSGVRLLTSKAMDRFNGKVQFAKDGRILISRKVTDKDMRERIRATMQHIIVVLGRLYRPTPKNVPSTPDRTVSDSQNESRS
jgi:hypothetical protein